MGVVCSSVNPCVRGPGGVGLWRGCLHAFGFDAVFMDRLPLLLCLWYGSVGGMGCVHDVCLVLALGGCRVRNLTVFGESV